MSTHEGPGMSRTVGKVRFSSDHRPRARYPYWQYCEKTPRHSWKKKGIKAKDVLLQERAEKFRGTNGPYVKKRTLLAFVEQLGHDHEALMENTRVESEDDNIPETVRPLRSAIGQRRDS